MLTLPSLTANEKVYLANKTLVSPDNLKVGDKILGVRVKQDNIKSISDVYTKIINEDRIIHSYEFCEATVYSTSKEDKTVISAFNDKKIKGTQYILIEPIPLKTLKSLSNYNNEHIENNLVPLMPININELKIENKTENINDIKILKVSEEGSSEMFFKEDIRFFQDYDDKVSTYSLTITGAHFYCTENFIVFALGGQ
jgi:hypothetical protein